MEGVQTWPQAIALIGVVVCVTAIVVAFFVLVYRIWRGEG